MLEVALTPKTYPKSAHVSSELTLKALMFEVALTLKALMFEVARNMSLMLKRIVASNCRNVTSLRSCRNSATLTGSESSASICFCISIRRDAAGQKQQHMV